MVVKKTYRRPHGAAPADDVVYRDLVPVAEFGTRLEADTVAALAKDGGFEVVVRGLTPFVVLAAESQRGAHLVLAGRAEAPAVRRYLEEHGAHIIDDSPSAQLNWRGAAIATATLVAFLLFAGVCMWMKGG